jgi:hypothetical protein
MRFVISFLLFIFCLSSCYHPIELYLVNGTRNPLDITLISDELELFSFPQNFPDSIIYINYEVRSEAGFLMESCENKDVRYVGEPIIKEKKISVCYYNFDTLSNSNKLSFMLPPRERVKIIWTKSGSDLCDDHSLSSIDTMQIAGKFRGQDFKLSIIGYQSLFNLIEDLEVCRSGEIIINKKNLNKIK